jgi:hypothetical protein
LARARGLAGYFTAMQNWIAADWFLATGNGSLHDWRKKILIG